MQEGDEIKIKIRSKITRGTQKPETHPPAHILSNKHCIRPPGAYTAAT